MTATSPRAARSLVVVALALFVSGPAIAQQRLTTPRQFFGFDLGDDYQLANYQQISAYWQRLAQESDRMVVDTIGITAEGRTMLMAIVSSPDNIRDREHYRQISQRLAQTRGLTDDDAHALAREGRAIVWIDGGLHATEVLGAQQLTEMVWQMVSRTDDETMRMLRDDIVLFVHANPDGNDLVADWYNRNPVPEQRSMAPGLPRLYQKYIGHDNNRDSYASTQPETEAMNRVMFREWFPQIVYNHHQSGPAGTVMFAPPFRDPFNYNFDPLLVVELDLVAAAMHSRFEAEDKPGVTMRTGSSYSTWWNGGVRTTAYFHNMIGILTETIGNPTPMRIPYVSRNVLPRGDLPFPIEPQEWHFRQSIDYCITANRAILDIASRERENLLYNFYVMGKRSVARGSRDSWTVTPTLVAEANDAMVQQRGTAGGAARGGYSGFDAVAEGFNPYDEVIRTPEHRDPRAYVLPSDQPDFLTATKFVNALLETGITVHRAAGRFEAGGTQYPAGSYVVFTSQAFRPHVLDMFEPQDHPNDVAYPGGPPVAPYDNAGWTLAYQMGVEFDRILDGFTGPFEEITDWNVHPRPGTVTTMEGAAGYVTSHAVNDAFHAVADLLAAGERVYWLTSPWTVGGTTHPKGTFYVAAGPATRERLERAARQLGVSFDAVVIGPSSGDLVLVKQPRIGLMDQYGGSMASGWTRWIMEQFGIPFERTYPPRVDRGDLNSLYDVLVFPDRTLPDPNRPSRYPYRYGGGRPETAAQADSIERTLPPEYRDERGRVSDTTLAAVRAFVENGGTVIAIGGSAETLVDYLQLPITNHLVVNGTPLDRTDFYVPGSIVRASVDTAQPLAAGLPAQVDVFFDNSPVFALAPNARARGVTPIAWYEGKAPLRSGWAWGQEHLDGGVAALQVRVGKGKVLLFGPEILHRGQPHGTFKFFFNALYDGQ